jgi:hypothetical protein
MESWRKVWREGIAPLMSESGLRALLAGLESDDAALTQGCTTTPPPMQSVLDWPCEGACVIGYAAWKGEGKLLVGEVEEYFADVCYRADMALGEPAAVRYFLNWFDYTPRDVMRAELLREVNNELTIRESARNALYA